MNEGEKQMCPGSIGWSILIDTRSGDSAKVPDVVILCSRVD